MMIDDLRNGTNGWDAIGVATKPEAVIAQSKYPDLLMTRAVYSVDNCTREVAHNGLTFDRLEEFGPLTGVDQDGAWLESHPPEYHLHPDGTRTKGIEIYPKRFGALFHLEGRPGKPGGCKLFGQLFAEVGHVRIYNGGQVAIALDDNGLGIDAESEVFSPPTQRGKAVNQIAVCSQVHQLFAPLLFAIGLLATANSTVQTWDPPAKLNKRRVRDGKLPLVRYRTLHIHPGKARRRESSSPGTGSPRGHHRVRPNWANYAADAPLFGRLTGRFYRPAHFRGDASEGEIHKTYKVYPS